MRAALRTIVLSLKLLGVVWSTNFIFQSCVQREKWSWLIFFLRGKGQFSSSSDNYFSNTESQTDCYEDSMPWFYALMEGDYCSDDSGVSSQLNSKNSNFLFYFHGNLLMLYCFTSEPYFFYESVEWWVLYLSLGQTFIIFYKSMTLSGVALLFLGSSLVGWSLGEGVGCVSWYIKSQVYCQMKKPLLIDKD